MAAFDWEVRWCDDLSGEPWLQAIRGKFDLIVEYEGPGFRYKTYVLDDDMDLQVDGIPTIDEAKEIAESLYVQYLIDMVGL